MTANEILQLAKANLGGGIDGSGVHIHTNDATIRLFMKRSFLKLSRAFPDVREATVPFGTNYIEIPSTHKVWTVLDVVPMKVEDSNTSFEIFDTHPAIFTVGGNYKDNYSHIYDYIRTRMNIRAMQVLVGKEFTWSAKIDNPNRIYVDDVPSNTTAFYVRFAVKAQSPPDDAQDPLNDSYDYSDYLSEYVIRDVTANLKISEGRILRKLRGGQQAAETDGAELVQEGTQELEALKLEIDTAGFNITNL